jgi:hypothetical protein
MSARAILEEMLALIKGQTEAVVSGDYKALLAGAARHEQLIGLLESAPVDASPEEIRDLCAQIDREKSKLRSLLEAESMRVDFLLRLILGGGQARTAGYPGTGGRQEGPSRLINQRA